MSYKKNLAAVVWIVALISQGIFIGCATRQLPSKKEIAVSPEVGFPPEVVAKVNAGKIRFEGGDGSSYGSAAIVVGATDSREEASAEYLWIARKHGIQERDWRPVQRSVLQRNGKQYDLLIINVAGKWPARTYYFDITDLSGKDEERGVAAGKPAR